MDPDIRPQDDLFGHVNGRWLDETEIPADKSSWGPSSQLADVAEEQVRDDHRGARRGVAPASTGVDDDATQDRRPLRHASWTRRADRGLGPDADRRPLLDAVAALRDVPRPGGVPRRARADRRRRPLRRPTSTPTTADADRYLVNLVQGGLGLPDESYYRDEKFAEIREKYVAHLDHGCSTLAGHADPAGAAATVLEVETRLAAGPLGARRDPRRAEDLQPDDPRRAAHELVPGASTGTPGSPHLGGAEETLAETLVRQPSYLEHLSTALEEVAHRGLAGLAAVRVRPRRRAVPPDGVRRGELRLLRPHPQRHARAAGPVEARRRLRRGRRSARRSARSTSRGTSRRASKAMMDELVAQPARGLPPLDRGAGLDERGDQAAGLRQARHVPPQDRLPRRSSATTPRSTSRPTTCSATSRRPPRSRPTASWRKIGSPVDRDEWLMLPQTVNAYYNPGHQRDLLPGRDPAAAVLRRGRRRRPRTTAASAR